MSNNVDSANHIKTVMGNIITEGAKTKKEFYRENLPTSIINNYNKRRIWLHDFEFFDNAINCLGVDIKSLVGKDVSGVQDVLEELFRSIIELTNYQSGGIGFINFDEYLGEYITTETDIEIRRAIASFFKNLNTPIRKGSETAYTTLNIGLDTSENGRRISRLLLEEYEKGYKGLPFIFPNIVFKMKKGINSDIGDPNYDLFSQASKVTAKWMIPTYFNTDASYNKTADSNKIGIMGCRTRVVKNYNKEETSLFRGNIAASTINLVQLAKESIEKNNDFFEILSNTMIDAKNGLEYRVESLIKNVNLSYHMKKNIYLDSSTKNKRKILRNGTLSIGFIGLYECVSKLLNQDLKDYNSILKVQELAYKIIEFMRSKIDSYSSEDYQFSLLATSGEGISGEFENFDSKDIEGTKGFYTNSFHVSVNIDLSCFEKIDIEAPYHKLCTGGSITYVELKESPQNNSEAIIELVKYACEKDINYFGINFPVDICEICGNKLLNHQDKCSCGSEDILKLRRVSGYLSPDYKFAQGKKKELENRIIHTGRL